MGSQSRRLSPELALAAACALADDAALAAAAPGLLSRPGFDWARFARLAAYHQVEQLARARLGDLCPGALPAEIEHRFRQRLMRDTALHAAQVRASAAVVDALGAAGVRALVLKGAGVAHLLYAPRPEFRRSSDIDILVAPEDLGAADRALVALGLARIWPEIEPTDEVRPRLLQLANVFDYSGPVLNERVELHGRPTGNLHALPVSFDEFDAASVVVETRHGPLRTPDGPLNVLYLSHHAMTSGDYRLKWFSDLARARQRGGADSCAQVVAHYPRALPMRTVHAVDGVLEWLEHGVAMASPMRRPAPALGKRTARVIDWMEQPRFAPAERSLARLPSDMSNLAFVFGLLPGPKARGRELLLALSDRRDAVRLQLAPRWAWLYAVAGPVLAAGRFARRARGTAAP